MNQMCKVCGEPAAGFHFGAFTCEGCKSFFGRSYNNIKSISDCKNGGMCVINKKNRTSCKACRLRKCMLVGMSKSGSRYGRRSNWFKMTCILEEHQRQQQLQHEHGQSLLVEHARESLAASRGEEGSSDEYNRSSSVSSRGSPNSNNSVEVSEGRDAYVNSPNFRALQPHIPGTAAAPLNSEIFRLAPGFPLNRMPYLPPLFPPPNLPIMPSYAGFYSGHGAAPHPFLQNSYSSFHQTAMPAFGNTTAENFANRDGDHLTSLINIKRKYCMDNSRVLSDMESDKKSRDSRISSPAASESAPQDNPIDLSMKQSSDDCSDEEVDLEDSDSDSAFHVPTQNPIDLTTPR